MGQVKTPKIYDGDIPFWDGNQLHYAGMWEARQVGFTWQPNAVFTDTLTVDRMERGRSAAYFYFTRKSTGKSVIVFMRDMLDMIRQANHGVVKGTFAFCKRGGNYGCKLTNGAE